jgi:predicted type IV restriction endonuclease
MIVSNPDEKINAQVIAVFPDKVKIVVEDLENFKIAEESLKVGSYLKIADNENAVLIAVIENFQISVGEGVQNYIIEAFPLGA